MSSAPLHGITSPSSPTETFSGLLRVKPHCTLSLSDLICCHECDYHKYADDTQLSKGAPPDQFQSLLCDIQTYIESLVGWMYSNKLKVNAEKTGVLPVASTSRLSSVGRDSVDIGSKRIPFRSSVRNLGVHLDQTLSMQQHISSVCRAAYLELRRIASI